MAKRFADEGVQTRVYSVHPGGVATDIYRSLPSAIASLIKKFLVRNEWR
jgi:NAD(P)-dependent dehydrogenase (short-subunit alcohol dehydrogenase family)